ncbi:MAG: hypothetical protein Q4A71_07450 [Actinomycetaceae bacterium]|nr:hypothetical protein [Actinomycetaceae bacterium]
MAGPVPGDEPRPHNVARVCIFFEDEATVGAKAPEILQFVRDNLAPGAVCDLEVFGTANTSDTWGSGRISAGKVEPAPPLYRIDAWLQNDQAVLAKIN